MTTVGDSSLIAGTVPQMLKHCEKLVAANEHAYVDPDTLAMARFIIEQQRELERRQGQKTQPVVQTNPYQDPEQLGFYWVRFASHWETAQYNGSQWWVFGKEWPDTAAYWGIVSWVGPLEMPAESLSP